MSRFIILHALLFSFVIIEYGLQSTCFKLGSFNAYNIGPSKLKKEDAMENLVEIILKFDVIALQEVTHKEEKESRHVAFKVLQLIRGKNRKYDYRISERNGTGRQEQHAFYFRNDVVEEQGTFQINEVVVGKKRVKYRYPPYAILFKLKHKIGNIDRVIIISVHTSPKELADEVEGLHQVVQEAIKNLDNVQDVILMGDVNLGKQATSVWNKGFDLQRRSEYYWPCENDKPYEAKQSCFWQTMNMMRKSTGTNTGKKNANANDRFILRGTKLKDAHKENACVGVFYHQKNIIKERKFWLSDHWPIAIWFREKGGNSHTGANRDTFLNQQVCSLRNTEGMGAKASSSALRNSVVHTGTEHTLQVPPSDQEHVAHTISDTTGPQHLAIQVQGEDTTGYCWGYYQDFQDDSKEMATLDEGDKGRIILGEKDANCYKKVGENKCLHPALLAAVHFSIKNIPLPGGQCNEVDDIADKLILGGDEIGTVHNLVTYTPYEMMKATVCITLKKYDIPVNCHLQNIENEDFSTKVFRNAKALSSLFPEESDIEQRCNPVMKDAQIAVSDHPNSPVEDFAFRKDICQLEQCFQDSIDEKPSKVSLENAIIGAQRTCIERYRDDLDSIIQSQSGKAFIAKTIEGKSGVERNIAISQYAASTINLKRSNSLPGKKKRSVASYDALLQQLADLYQDPVVLAKKAINSTCTDYGNRGDCKFYECFDERFPCDTEELESHQINFEAVNCNLMTQNAEALDNKEVTQFVTSYQQCLTTTILPDYSKKETKCSALRSSLHERRTFCLIQADFCNMLTINRTALEYFLTVSTNMEGYPAIIPWRRLTLPLSGRLVKVPPYYYQHLAYMKEAIYAALEECAHKASKSGPLYTRHYIQDGDNDGAWYYIANF